MIASIPYQKATKKVLSTSKTRKPNLNHEGLSYAKRYGWMILPRLRKEGLEIPEDGPYIRNYEVDPMLEFEHCKK